LKDFKIICAVSVTNFIYQTKGANNMDTRSKTFLLSFFVFLMVMSAFPCRADDKARDRKTLRGIQAVVVMVHPLEPEWKAELEKIGVTESALEVLVEQQLKKPGIPVLSMEAADRTEFEGFLNVRMKFSDPEPAKKQFQTFDNKGETFEKVDLKKRYVYAIRLNLRQLVSLQRDPSVKAFSITWQAESVGIRRLTFIQEDIKSLVDAFIEAYTSENPAALKTN
jgi:hypothetical protein